MQKPLTSSIIATHERLFPRLAALLKQVERARGNAPVPEETARLARELCREASKLLGREGRRVGLPDGKAGKAGLDHQGLAVVLGQVVAGLEAFEAAHSGRDISGNAVWRLPGGKTLPVARLRLAGPGWAASAPKFGLTDRDPYTPDDETIRTTVLKRILQRENAVYLEGYRDGVNGKPPRKPLTEIGPVNESKEI